MLYPQAFLDLQLLFARRMSAISGQPFHESVLHYTALYRILGLDWNLDPHDPVWARYLAGLRGDDAEADGAWTYQVYCERNALGVIPDHVYPRWGCFAYEYQPDAKTIRLHFGNLDASGYGPLHHLRTEARRAELWSMFSSIQRAHPDAAYVHGGSWLYNREEYRRLFPPAFGASAQAMQAPLIGRGLWGQFLRHGERINAELAARFTASVATLAHADDYAGCFPYQVLLTHAPIADFYAFYGIAAVEAQAAGG
ncbi:MAG: hypothetical protein ABI068_16585 [Ktedonobacterales bacterium]